LPDKRRSAEKGAMLSTDKAWEKFGRHEPYFGVLAEEKFTTANIAENRDEFFASGRWSVSQIIHRHEAHFGPLGRGRALDHGCGVGRLSMPLAQNFSEVIGLDISPSMLSEAQSNARELGFANAEFALADDRLSNAPGEFDFVTSYMVLQHIRVRRGLRLLSRLLEKVRPGGGFHFHFSIRTDRLGSRALWWASHHIPGVKIWQNIFAGRPWNAPAMQMNNYSLNRIVVLLAANGISEFLVATERHAQFVTVSVIGRKPETG
jgi:2-polyprenyl-3-methyl-5-hydroxy-6-metoxy-1,4-benzoquinol methylase